MPTGRTRVQRPFEQLFRGRTLLPDPGAADTTVPDAFLHADVISSTSRPARPPGTTHWRGEPPRTPPIGCGREPADVHQASFSRSRGTIGMSVIRHDFRHTATALPTSNCLIASGFGHARHVMDDADAMPCDIAQSPRLSLRYRLPAGPVRGDGKRRILPACVSTAPTSRPRRSEREAFVGHALHRR